MHEDWPLHTDLSTAAAESETETEVETETGVETGTDEQAPPAILVRGRSVLALVVAPRWPLDTWLATLDAQAHGGADLLGQRPVVVNLAAALDDERGPDAALEALVALAARGVKVIGVEGIDPSVFGQTRWARLPIIPPGRESILKQSAGAPSIAAAPAAPSPSLLIDRPVRSGQSIVFDQGDITVIGSVSSGAEVIAGGSIQVYGALRGRAIAGLTTGAAARIFCQKLEAEMIAVDDRYRTAEHWGADLHGRAVQVRRDRDGLRFSALD
jgi:septum site-determining protein MinC